MTKVVSYSVALAVLALLLTACGSGDEAATSPTPVGDETPTGASSTPTPSVPIPTGTVKRTTAELTKALLELKDLPTGFQEDKGTPERAKYQFSTSNSNCKRLVRYLNLERPPGSKASARRSFTGGQQGPFMDFTLDSQGTAGEVAQFRGAYERAVRDCPKVTMRVPGQGSSPMEVKAVPAPKQGIDPFAFQLTGTGGPLEGREVSTAVIGLGDVLLVVGVVAAQPGEVEAAAEAATTKSLQLLATTK